jgi:hypothetical protein
MTGVKRKINKILDTKRDYNKMFNVGARDKYGRLERPVTEVKIKKGKKSS